MALVRLYFSTTGAGAADGTTWTDRAALLTAGAPNTLILGFDFTTNTLECYVGPGTYALTTGFVTFTSTAPTLAIPCILQACDPSGVMWVPPNPGWVSAQPVWDTSGMPVFATTTNINTVNHVAIIIRGIKFTASGSTSNPPIASHHSIDWVHCVNSASNTNVFAVSGTPNSQTNCCLEVTGTAYNAVSNSVLTSIGTHDNIRLQGNASASSGNRRGWGSGTNSRQRLSRITSFNNVGGGVVNTSTGSSARLDMDRSVIYGSGAAGVSVAGTSATPGNVSGCVIVGSGTYGIDVTGTGRMGVWNSRFRNNTSGNFNGVADWPTDWNNLLSAGTDADEFVDVAGGDFRIKSGSALHGKGYGAGDQATSSGASGGYIIGS